MGNVLNLESGLMNTWHFSLFNSLFNRIRRSKHRTTNPNEASLFFIPYDFGMDGNFRKDCTKVHRCSPGYVDNILNNISSQPYFTRFNGSDHVLLWSLGHYHPWPKNDCNILMSINCKNCAITCYWMDPTLVNNHFISIPFPSSYHWNNKIIDQPWLRKSNPNRTFIISYLGGIQTLNPDHTKIRREMTEQCKQIQNKTLCNWIQITHSSTDKLLTQSIQVYRHSIFCLCPPGDDPARKALFDIILSGCIPVLFHPSTLYNQYPLHFTENLAREISIYIPGKQLRLKQLKMIDLILSISPEVIKKKQQALELIAPKLQYSMPPLEMLQDIYNEKIWDPPFDDAVSLLIEGLYNRVQNIKKNQSTNIPPLPLSNAEWFQRYNSFTTS